MRACFKWTVTLLTGGKTLEIKSKKYYIQKARHEKIHLKDQRTAMCHRAGIKMLTIINTDNKLTNIFLITLVSFMLLV